MRGLVVAADDGRGSSVQVRARQWHDRARVCGRGGVKQDRGVRVATSRVLVVPARLELRRKERGALSRERWVFEHERVAIDRDEHDVVAVGPVV